MKNGSILDEKQKAFLKLVMSPGEKGTNSFTEKVSRLVEKTKQNLQNKTHPQ